MTIIGEIHSVQLGEKLRKGIEINFVLADMEKRIVWSGLSVCSCVEGRRSKQRPLLRVSATRLRASAS